ncbi:Arginase, catabolizes arginine to ornithine and urea [Chytriomyces hyalinus]|nr:Arginase, catabolizes arginine to ornithine and urea [Chytriomyces hyalinus]
MAPRATRAAPASNGAAAKKRKTDPAAAHSSFDEDIINRIVNTRSKQRYLKSQSVALIGAGFSGGQPKGGVDQGPTVLFNEGNLVSQIKELEWEVEVEDHFPQMVHLKPNHEDNFGILKNVEYTSKVTHRIHDSVKKACEDGKLALTIGGDHSIAIGTVSGSLAVHKNIGLIWVDAHGDINTPEVTTSGNLHGCPVAFVSGLAGEVPPFNTWLKPEFDLSRIVYIGLRDLDGPEKKIIRDNNIKAFSMHEVDKWGIGRVVDAAVKYLYETAPDTKEHPCERNEDGNKMCPIHLSFDVDGLDPSVAPATGTPVRGGLTFREGHYIMEALHQTGSLVAVDITEVNPELGTVMERQTTISINTGEGGSGKLESHERLKSTFKACAAVDSKPEKALQDALRSHATGKGESPFDSQPAFLHTLRIFSSVVTASDAKPQKEATEPVTMKFRVFGKVQGVFFRKHTAAKAVKLGLVGYVRNNHDAERSVEGVVMGPREKVNDLLSVTAMASLMMMMS